MLRAADAAAALAEGFGRAGAHADELPVADGGEGTADVLHRALGGEWHRAAVSDPLGRPVEARWLLLPDGVALVESAEAIGLGHLRPDELDPLRASSRGLGELIAEAISYKPRRLAVGLGGSATVDGGAGLREVLGTVPPGTIALCDVRNPLLGERGAARVFGPQKGASPEEVGELERRIRAMPELRPVARLPGAGAAGGLGAALAALGADLVPGASFVLDRLGLRDRLHGAALAVTGEGAVDRTSFEGKAVGEIVAACGEEGVRCAVFAGRIGRDAPEAELHALSGQPERAHEDLVELGERLGGELRR